MSWLTVSVGIGVFGDTPFGQLPWLGSFHMSCMILTGMGAIAGMCSESAQLFSSFYALYSGIAFLGSTAVFLAPIIHRGWHILQAERGWPHKVHAE